MTHLEQKMEDQIKDLNTKLEEVIIKLDQYKNILGKISGNKVFILFNNIKKKVKIKLSGMKS